MKYIVTFVVGLVLGFWIGCNRGPQKEVLIETRDSLVVRDSIITKEVVRYKDKIKTIRETKDSLINNIQELPLDSTVTYIREEIERYEEIN